MVFKMNGESDWAMEEFQDVKFGDKRLDCRLIRVVGSLSNMPKQSIPTATEGWAETQAAYRMFANEKVTLQRILEPHAEQTMRRVAKQPVVLVLQDTTELDYTKKRDKNRSAGPLNYEDRVGFLLHPSIAVTPDGLHLGTVAVNMWARPEKLGKSAARKTRDFEDKESRRWRDGYGVSRDVAEACPKTTVINVADRESDIFEYLVEATGERPENSRFVVRASQDRCLTELDEAAGGNSFVKMRERLRESEPLGEITIDVPKRGNRKRRQAVLEIRVGRLELKAPSSRRNRLPNVTVNVAWAKEKDPPKGEKEPLDWLLLTDLPVETFDQAVAVLDYYSGRWQVEVFFRVLKSGCAVEELEFHTVENFAPCLMLYMVVSWRILNLMMLSRECPDLPCEVLLMEAEWKAAWHIHKHEPPPDKAPSLGEMVKIISSLGGHLGRKCDGPPGPKSLWIGLQRVSDFAIAWTTFGPDHNAREMRCV